MRYGISSLVLVSALYLAAGESAKSASEWEEGIPMTTTVAETYDFFMVTRARKKIGLENDTEAFTLGIGGTTVGYLAVVYQAGLYFDGYVDDFSNVVEKLSNAKYLKRIDFDFSDTKIKRRENKYGYLQYMDRTDSRYRCIVYAQRLGAVLGSEYVFGRLCLNTRHREVANLDQHLFEFIENLRTDGSGKQLTALRGEGSKKRSPSKAAPATPATTSIYFKEILRAKGLSGAEAFQEAKNYIGTNCLNHYERYEERHSSGLETAFAYAQERIGGRYACGGSYSMIVENAKDRALDKCERAREKHGVNAPCEILAIGNKIVWEGETDGSGKQLTALRGEGSKKRSPSKTAVDLPDGSNIETYLYKPSGKGPYPAVIVLPVRGGMNEYSKDFSDELSRAGYVTLTVNFRTGSGWPDAKIGATYDYLQKLPEVDPQRIGMVGFSKGGELGLETIFDWGNGFPPRPIRAMVSYYLGSNLRFPQSDDPPILFLHGDKDHRTQWQEVVAFCEESRKAGRVCDYKIYKDTYHSFTHSPSNYSPFAERDAYKRTVAFLNKHLRDAPIQ